MASYWIGVASREHVLRGISGGFCQVCHGKGEPLKRMEPNDWIAYYSPTERFGGKAPCRKFTAIGKISQRSPYLFQMSEDFTPWRRDVLFLKAEEAEILPLLPYLSFIKDKKRWGFPFRRGCFSVAKSDFLLIANSMGIEAV